MAAIDYSRDIVRFMLDFVPVETGQMIMPQFLQNWLYTSHPLPEGNPAARNVLDARTKKQGKTTKGAGVILYHATRRPHAECVIAAADKDQAKDRVFRAAKFAVENGPLASHAKVYRDVIEFDNSSIIQALPMDWRGAAGGNYACIVFDELHGYTLENQRRLFDELVIPPTQPNGVRWIASYAGFLGESVLLWELWQKALSGIALPGDLPIYHNQDASLLAFIDTGEASWRMPWTQGEEGRRYIEQVQASERPNTFRRLWLNEWLSNESQFVSKEQWEACYSPEVRRWSDGDSRQLVLGADASTSRDLTALVGTVYNQDLGRVEVVYIRVWRPERGIYRDGKPTIDLDATIGAEVLRLHNLGCVASVHYDPYQLHSVALSWERSGVRCVEMPQTSQRVEADQSLYDAIIGRSIAHHNDAVLNEHINNAVAVESPRGYRLAKEKTSKKIDAAVALSMSHHAARAAGAYYTDIEIFTLGDGRRWDNKGGWRNFEDTETGSGEMVTLSVRPGGYRFVAIIDANRREQVYPGWQTRIDRTQADIVTRRYPGQFTIIT